MKRIIRRVSLLAAALMIISVPVLAEEGAMTPNMEPADQNVKNECLLVARNCSDQTDSINERIDRIQNEIKKGTSVYTNDELNRLRDKLDDANRTLNELTTGA
jgi:archaellum component FlaC